MLLNVTQGSDFSSLYTVKVLFYVTTFWQCLSSQISTNSIQPLLGPASELELLPLLGSYTKERLTWASLKSSRM